MLAAYGFFYNSIHDRLKAAQDLEAAPVKDDRPAQAASMAFAVRAALALAVAAWLVFATFAVTAVQVIVDSFHEATDGGGYNPIRAGLVLVEAFWLALAIGTSYQWFGLDRKKQELSKSVEG